MNKLWTALSITAFASLSLAQTSSLRKVYSDFESARPEISRQLKGLNRGPEGQLRVRSIDPERLEQGIGRLNRAKSINIDLGTGENIEIQSGGVIVGSGADGLAATTNEDLLAPIVIQPPLDLNTTITIIGDPKETYCAHRINTQQDGTLVQYGTRYLKQSQVCAKSGVALRLIKAGTFVIWASSTGATKNFAIVPLQDGENKVIPLRQLIVPHHPGIAHQLQSDVTSITEQEKFLILAYSSDDRPLSSNIKFKDSLGYAGKKMSFEEFKTHSHLVPSDSGGNIFGMKYYHHTDGVFSTSEVYFLASLDPNGTWGVKQGGHTYFVFPGVYALSWKIDGQTEKPTMGIHVR